VIQEMALIEVKNNIFSPTPYIFDALLKEKTITFI